MKITKEQIKKAYQDKEYLKELFPSVFEEKLETSKWYKYENGGLFFAVNDFKDDSNIGYGFIGDEIKTWTNKFHYYKCHNYRLRLATKEEVETALIAEAKKRRFKGGVKIKNTGINSQFDWELIFSGEFNFIYERNLLECNSGCGHLFDNGVWAEIIEEPLELTLEQIAEKFNVDNVKIIKS